MEYFSKFLCRDDGWPGLSCGIYKSRKPFGFSSFLEDILQCIFLIYKHLLNLEGFLSRRPPVIFIIAYPVMLKITINT